jgi:hypothetical protein
LTKHPLPSPETSQLQGEEEPVIQVETHYPPRMPTQHPQDRGAAEAGERMRVLFQEGKGKRAVVCKKEFAGDKTNPRHWGIVYDCEPFSPYPLKIQWVERGVTRSNGDDILVVYHGVAQNEMAKLIDAYNMLRQ